MGEQDPADFVLKAFSKVEQKDLADFIGRGAFDDFTGQLLCRYPY
jgi:hypothetical protein